ncbi:MAG: 3-methyl-2-oxobutanoate hydroxymethyltransferase [Phycisphaerales bacterium]|jgi:3-methyl-2-oxobutanoate hydroxymethyltransferase|nr:3-methyl-2-oxobutanoate hydroxymethyltransferase [Phycisphaerales bacterium]
MATNAPKSITLRTLQQFAERGERFACLTAYDATTARHLERAGIPLLLVGDTAAEMVLGLQGTIHAPLDFLLTLTAAVKRGAPRTFVMGDMPFMSYQADEAEGIRNAGRFLTEGTADAVKVEVDGTFTGLVSQMDRAGIPVCAHIGSRPQRAKHEGGYRAAGRTPDAATRIVEDALRLEDAGACLLLIEATPAEVAERIVQRVGVPVIGCGAGPACHGQIVVTQDILGLTDWQPAFAKPVADVAAAVQAAAVRWKSKVAACDLGEHPYQMIDESQAKP